MRHISYFGLELEDITKAQYWINTHVDAEASEEERAVALVFNTLVHVAKNQ